MSIRIERFDGVAITNEIIAAGADLFSQNYGVWGPQAAAKMTIKRLKQGNRIQMSPSNLVQQILPSSGQNKYVRASRDGELIGNVFGTRWFCDKKAVMWVTQLCVKSGYRSQGVAKMLLKALYDDEYAVGVLSSHAHAILAVSHICGKSVKTDFTMAQNRAKTIIKSCPVQYVRNAKLHGSLFEEVKDGSVSCAGTNFWVDHKEPLEALAAVRSRGTLWPFGELPHGHDFLVLVEVRLKGDTSEQDTLPTKNYLSP